MGIHNFYEISRNTQRLTVNIYTSDEAFMGLRSLKVLDFVWTAEPVCVFLDSCKFLNLFISLSCVSFLYRNLNPAFFVIVLHYLAVVFVVGVIFCSHFDNKIVKYCKWLCDCVSLCVWKLIGSLRSIFLDIHLVPVQNHNRNCVDKLNITVLLQYVYLNIDNFCR